MGRNNEGKQVRHYKTFIPPEGMNERRAEKEAEKVALKFEEELRLGFQSDSRITFKEYADYFMQTRRKTGLKRSTYEHYEALLTRINAAIGHMKLNDIRPQHLNIFYENLMEDDIRQQPATATAKPAFTEKLEKLGIIQQELSRRSQVAASTIRKARNGEEIHWDKAEALAKVLDCPAESLFDRKVNHEPLSAKTVLEHHRLIRTILGQAERELVVPYNAASKSTPPKNKRSLVNSFQPQEIVKILEALETEPIKWRTIVHLMIVTGCRRGEIMGLKWENVDLEHCLLCICETLLTSNTGKYTDTPKTMDSRRYVNIPQETAELLKQYQQEQNYIRTVVGDRWQETGFVFTQETGQPMHPDSINGWLNGFSERHGLPHINPHAFRHSLASILINSGTDILTISKRLGHTTTSTTLNFYGHLIQKADAESSECIADVLLRSPYKKGDDEAK